MINPQINYKQVIYKWDSLKNCPLSHIKFAKNSLVNVEAFLSGEILECKFKSPTIVKAGADSKSSLWVASKNAEEDTAKDRINHQLLFLGKEKKKTLGNPTSKDTSMFWPFINTQAYIEFQEKKQTFDIFTPKRMPNYLTSEQQGCWGSQALTFWGINK